MTAPDDGPKPFRIRKATPGDAAAIEGLIARSARRLGAGDYSPAQIEGALSGAFGLDTPLIEDGTYFVVEEDRRLAGCGGWSYRRTLFGGDAEGGRNPESLDPARDAAKIRAFFVDPPFARRGIGTAILERCEREAWNAGFHRAELMATLAGARLYAARGYIAGETILYPLGEGLTIPFLPMTKRLRPRE